MRKIAGFFQLIRWRNLLMVLLTQWVVWICVISPVKHWSGILLFLDAFRFSLLAGSTVLIAAAGYIINDYFDVKIDIINRPQKVIIDKVIGRRQAILWHSAFNIAGMLLAVYLAWQQGNYVLPAVQLISILLLWLYSTTYKRMFVSGNIIVALLAALTVLVPAIYEPALYPYLRADYFVTTGNRILVNPLWVIGAYAYFAFMLTWMREIVKDMEDFKGDAEQGCVTMPIKIGLRRSAHMVILLGTMTILPLAVASIRLCIGNWLILGIYIAAALVIPLIMWLIFLDKKTDIQHYGKASRLLKIIMLSGIITLLVYYGMQC